jgi:hypothetical protein
MSFGIPVRNGLGVGLLASTTLSSLRIGGRPAMSLDFIGTNSLDSRITFTRATTATFVGSNGFIQTAAINTPRFGYDPVTLAPRGLLIEEARTNLLLQSQTFETASWSKILSTVSSNAANGPDNALTADKFIPNNGATISGAITSQDISKAASAITYTYSVFGKSDGFDRILLRCQDSGGSTNRANVTVNISTGAIVTAAAAAGTFTNASARVTTYKNGYFRVELTFTSSTDTLLRSQIYALDSVATTGDGVKGILIWGAQLEAGGFATSYIPTVASTVARNADAASMTGTNFSSWYNASEGSLVASGSFFALGSNTSSYRNALVGLSDGTSANAMQIGKSVAGLTTDRPATFSSNGNFSQSISGVTITASSIVTMALGLKANSVFFAANGVAGVEDTSCSVPIANQLGIGNFEAAGLNALLNGHIRAIAYYNTRLPNATLQALTA